ncbi:MAG TPA: hypothetical protein PLB99_14710 [Thermotogota bacterium]|nr:hypothetical protein [Thermotogota bacterium]
MENKDLARIINHPHDHYFKSTFGKKEVARNRTVPGNDEKDVA